MLHLTSEQELQLRTRPKKLTKELLFGFCLALLLHLLFFATFQVEKRPLPKEDQLLPSIAVQIDLGRKQGRTAAHLQTWAPSLPMQAPSLPTFAQPKASFLPKEQEISNADFSECEKIPYTP